MSTDFPLRNDENPEEDLVSAPADDEAFIDDGVLYDDEVTPEYGILGFTLRELLIVGVWIAHFVLSFFPIVVNSSLWSTGIEWVLPVGVPTAAVFLLVLRRFSPDGIRRVGSLGIDQFASVAFSVAAIVLVGRLWLAIAGAIGSGFWALSWSGIALVVTSLALVALTVFAPIIPGLKEDFQGRLVTLAHRAANPVRPVIARPRPEPVAVAAPAAAPENAPLDVELSGANATDEIARVDIASQVPLSAHASGGGIGTEQVVPDEDYTPAYSRRSSSEDIAYDTDSIVALVTPETDAVEPIAQTVAPEPTAETWTVQAAAAETAVVEPATEPAAAEPAVEEIDVEATNPRYAAAEQQPFWILAPTERDVHDERGEAIFQIGPTAWALVIEDRGGAYVVRHDDGRIGYLHDISDITKG
ncbi:MAG: hypothetical protein JF592_11020 [Microbacterium sp.]|uniref:hypothetical protein n=1 Tax=Microbacterium sp. TaxID=51671 RepID=UPI001D77B410|nr:hypothetical protein [Microbacterium sp.]MBW8763101.1 hypothetical protein [Microbacterium sp.]